MAGITLAQAEAQLSTWLTALTDIAENGQAVTIHGRSYTAADLDQVQKQVDIWDSKVKQLSRGSTGARIRGLTPRH